MFGFKNNTLNPAIRDAAEKIDTALGLQNIEGKIEKLLDVRQYVEESFKKISAAQDSKGIGMAAAGLFAALALAVAGAGVTTLVAATAIGVCGVTLIRSQNVSGIRRLLVAKIDTEVRNIFQAVPKADTQSSTFLAILKKPAFIQSRRASFNISASVAQRYEAVKRSAGMGSKFT